MRAWLALAVCLCSPGLPYAAAPPARPAASSPLYAPPRRPAVPEVADATWARNPIDHFVLARLESKRLVPNRAADRLKLLRRVTVDLTGLPPTASEQEAFLADASPDAYAKVVSRLLDSPRFGERWATYWLDLVRYAETDGFKEDALRPDAWRYRDWVVRAFNSNLPYDRFVAWQLAGDELAPDDPDALTATGFSRLWPDEYNAANLEQRRQEILDDHTDAVGLVFMGLTVGCARCHDHKYDPTSQRDYFRLQSFFSAMQPKQLVVADAAARRDYEKRRRAWEATTKDVRAEIDRLLDAKTQALRKDTLGRFNPEIQKAVLTPPERRTPLQTQIALMALKQIDRGGDGAAAKLDAAGKKRHAELLKELAGFGPPPAALATAHGIGDVGPVAPATHRLVGGDWRKPAKEVMPAFPEFLGGGPASARRGEGGTGRRSAVAAWLTRADHPLTARVIVNRLWQHHFGVGIVATASDFGAQGTPPTHPELLDWLAVELVASGWDLKHVHRLMVTSATYRQDSVVEEGDAERSRGYEADRGNELLWRARRRRLEGEAIRDAVLALAGDLSPRAGGVSARPELPASFGKAAWKVDEDESSRNRRSVYVFAKRNLRYPLFDAFDLPDMHNSCSRRMQTTTAPQALMLLNGELTLAQSRRWAVALKGRHGADVEALLREAYRSAWGRAAGGDEVASAKRFLTRQAEAHRRGAPGTDAEAAALADFCHALMNSNEFVFVD